MSQPKKPRGTQVRGECGHLKGAFDNHPTCRKCCLSDRGVCSADNPCEWSSKWSSATWKKIGKSRPYALRKEKSQERSSSTPHRQEKADQPPGADSSAASTLTPAEHLFGRRGGKSGPGHRPASTAGGASPGTDHGSAATDHRTSSPELDLPTCGQGVGDHVSPTTDHRPPATDHLSLIHI